MDAALARRHDPLCLPLADELTLRLRDVAEQLQYNVRDQLPGQVAVLPRVQQRHIQNDDRGPLRLRDDAPLLENFGVVPAQPVDALHDQRVAWPQPPQHPPILHPFKIRPRLLIEIYIFRRDPHFPQCCELAGFVLLFGRNSCVPINLSHLLPSQNKKHP